VAVLDVARAHRAVVLAIGVALSCSLLTPSTEAESTHRPIHSYKWRKADGSCRVPKPYRPWSRSRLRKVDGLQGKKVIFTVDGGLVPEALEQAASALHALEVRATFFLMTDPLAKATRGKEIVRKLIEHGHELGNHTASHPKLSKLSDERIRAELQDAERFMKDALGDDFHATPLLREPFLDRDERTDRMAEELCLRSVWFTVYTRDDEAGITAKQIEEAVLRDRGKKRKLEPGTILMFHASQKENRRAWPKIVKTLRDRGYDFIPLGEALRNEH
jgi:peptidoglycan/xylan/chitin deacetylase (PgdA/CDA1 family)